jgi:hypothetical protein
VLAHRNCHDTASNKRITGVKNRKRVEEAKKGRKEACGSNGSCGGYPRSRAGAFQAVASCPGRGTVLCRMHL